MIKKVDVVRTKNSWKTTVNEANETVLVRTKNGYSCHKQNKKEGR